MTTVINNKQLEKQRVVWRKTVLSSLITTITLFSMSGVSLAEDRELSAEELRTVIATMEEVSHLAEDKCDTQPTPTLRLLCRNGLSERNKCYEIKRQIMSRKDDFVFHPLVKTDEYNQKEFDAYAGKCRGTHFNESGDNLLSVKNYKYGFENFTAESDIRLYKGDFFQKKHDTIIVFGRDYKEKTYALSPYPKSKIVSIFSIIDEKKCEAKSRMDVEEVGHYANSGTVNNSKSSIVYVDNSYYYVDYYETDRGGREVDIRRVVNGMAYQSDVTCMFE